MLLMLLSLVLLMILALLLLALLWWKVMTVLAMLMLRSFRIELMLLGTGMVWLFLDGVGILDETRTRRATLGRETRRGECAVQLATKALWREVFGGAEDTENSALH